MIAALFVAADGPYIGIEGVDPWPEERDARKYRGPHPVIAHPPCSRWCQLAHINQKRYGHRVGHDDGCFEAALAAVRRWGGVLEHPARTYAWATFNLPKPVPRQWTRGLVLGEWVAEVAQGAYGHRAIKKTWLYCFTRRYAPPALDWRIPRPTAQVSFCKNHGNSPLPRLSKKEAAATPPAFREALLRIASGC